jgi:hypothetical protein
VRIEQDGVDGRAQEQVAHQQQHAFGQRAQDAQRIAEGIEVAAAGARARAGQAVGEQIGGRQAHGRGQRAQAAGAALDQLPGDRVGQRGQAHLAGGQTERGGQRRQPDPGAPALLAPAPVGQPAAEHQRAGDGGVAGGDPPRRHGVAVVQAEHQQRQQRQPVRQRPPVQRRHRQQQRHEPQQGVQVIRQWPAREQTVVQPHQRAG